MPDFMLGGPEACALRAS